MRRYSKRSLNNLKGIHPDLRRVIDRALQDGPLDFIVIEGLRTMQRQRELMASGASKTMNSRHLTGHAVDIAPLAGGEVSWDWPLYYQLEPVVKQAAVDLGVALEWGGDWKSFKDGPHWQLSWKAYSKDDMKAKARTAPERPARPEPDPLPTTAPDEPKSFLEALLALFGGRK